MENNDPWSDGFPIFVLQVIVLAAAYMWIIQQVLMLSAPVSACRIDLVVTGPSIATERMDHCWITAENQFRIILTL